MAHTVQLANNCSDSTWRCRNAGRPQRWEDEILLRNRNSSPNWRHEPTKHIQHMIKMQNDCMKNWNAPGIPIPSNFKLPKKNISHSVGIHFIHFTCYKPATVITNCYRYFSKKKGFLVNYLFFSWENKNWIQNMAQAKEGRDVFYVAFNRLCHMARR